MNPYYGAMMAGALLLSACHSLDAWMPGQDAVPAVEHVDTWPEASKYKAPAQPKVSKKAASSHAGAASSVPALGMPQAPAQASQPSADLPATASVPPNNPMPIDHAAVPNVAP